MNSTAISRRHLLQAGAASATIAAAAACGADDDTPPAGNPGSGGTTTTSGRPSATGGQSSAAASPSGRAPGGSSVLPAYVPREIAKPDRPATDSGALPAFFAYPKSPVRVRKDPVLSGGSVSSMLLTYLPTPTPLDSNPYWKELNKRLGAELKVAITPAADYWQKLSVTVAGNDIPELVAFNPSSALPSHLGDLLEAKFTDLSPWLSGDKASAYPNLAALPTTAWKSTLFKGGLFGVPYPTSLATNTPKIRADIITTLGANPTVKDGQGLLDLCAAVTDQKERRWAMGRLVDASAIVEQMVGVPNVWRVQDGEFISAYATDEYKTAIDLVAKMWKAGVIHPDGPSMPSAKSQSSFLAGSLLIAYLGAGGWGTDPSVVIDGFLAPKWEGGGQSSYHQTKGSFLFTGVRKGSDSRVKELLSVLDWLATPFGSEEYLFFNYGLPDIDYTLDGTDPIKTDRATTEVSSLNVHFIATPVRPTYFPGNQDQTARVYDFEKALLSVSEPLPTVGVRSETQLAKGAALDKPLTDLKNDIILGRKPLSEWDNAVKTWKSNGGSKIAAEYAASYAAQPGGAN